MIFCFIQINVVVSGALDRLHSEKDPCVKYDVNRKLWIYLHRSRSEEEFGKAKHIVHGHYNIAFCQNYFFHCVSTGIPLFVLHHEVLL